MEILTPLKPKKNFTCEKIEREIFVLDTETNGLSPRPDKFIFACLRGHNYRKYFFTPQDVINEFKKPLFWGKTIFAHNAEFDAMAIWGNVISELDNQACYNGSLFISAYIDRDKKIKLADSSNVLKSSVAKIGQSMGHNKMEIESEFKSGTYYGCVSPQMMEYCATDCNIIFSALSELFEFIGDIKLTIASCALSYFKRFFMKTPIHYDRNLVNEFFKSYYGGRTEAFKIGKFEGQFYDINSEYPYIMATSIFPNPSNLKKIEKPHKAIFDQILKHGEGMAHVKIKHPETYIGCVPYRDEKLLFPVGTFWTYLNFPEIRNAINNGCEILDIEYCVYSNDCIDSPFTEYVNFLYELKTQSTGFKELYIKYLLNSLYGKFGEKIQNSTIYCESIFEAEIYLSENIEKDYELKLISSERDDCYLCEIGTIADQPKHSIPLFPSYITTNARLLLYDGLQKNLESIPIYSDTDSIVFEKEPTNLPISNKLGDYKRETKKIQEIRGLKNYSYIDEKEPNIIIDKIKGIPNNSNTEKINENTFKTYKYMKSKQSIRHDKEAGSNFYLTKTLSNTYDKRTVHKDGNTSPLVLNQ